MLFVLNISHLMNVPTYGTIIARAAQSTVALGCQLCETFTCANSLFNCLSLKPVKSVYCSVIRTGSF